MDDIKSVMASYGFYIIGDINYNNFRCQRFKNAKKPSRGRDIFLYLHQDKGATFGDWHDKDNHVTWWQNKGERPTPREYQIRQAHIAEMEKKRYLIRCHAISRAFNLWSASYISSSCENHPYVINKRITPYYGRQIKHCRWLKDCLLIPIRDIHYNFMGVQIIKSNGFKRLWKGTSQKENMIWLCELLPDHYRGTIYICEGYSTGCTIHEAMNSPVICAINANNLSLVCQSLKKKFPLATLMICADNDTWGQENTGIKCAITAMEFSGAIMRRPSFANFDVSKKPTDFNDLLCLGGMEIVRNQIIKQYK